MYLSRTFDASVPIPLQFVEQSAVCALQPNVAHSRDNKHVFFRL